MYSTKYPRLTRNRPLSLGRGSGKTHIEAEGPFGAMAALPRPLRPQWPARRTS